MLPSVLLVEKDHRHMPWALKARGVSIECSVSRWFEVELVIHWEKLRLLYEGSSWSMALSRIEVCPRLLKLTDVRFNYIIAMVSWAFPTFQELVDGVKHFLILSLRCIMCVRRLCCLVISNSVWDFWLLKIILVNFILILFMNSPHIFRWIWHHFIIILSSGS